MEIIKKVFLILCFLITGCSPVSYMNIDVLEPAEITLPPSVQSFAVGIKKDALQNDYKDNKEEVEDFFSRNYFWGINNTLSQSPRIKYLYLYDDKPIGANNKSLFMQIQWDSVEQICEKTHSDALIAIEYYTTADTIYINYDKEAYRHRVRLLHIHTTLWRIYDPVKKNVLDEYLQKDTVIWMGQGIRTAEALEDIPGIIDAGGTACYQSAEKYGLRIAPVWESERRKIYSPCKSGMWNAYQQLKQDQWQKASQKWINIIEDPEVKQDIQWKAAYNMAVLSEIRDELTIAVEWAKKAYELSANARDIQAYLTLLRERIKDKERIYKQLSVE
jgi:hypothetical protein